MSSMVVLQSVHSVFRSSAKPDLHPSGVGLRTCSSDQNVQCNKKFPCEWFGVCASKKDEQICV